MLCVEVWLLPPSVLSRFHIFQWRHVPLYGWSQTDCLFPITNHCNAGKAKSNDRHCPNVVHWQRCWLVRRGHGVVCLFLLRNSIRDGKVAVHCLFLIGYRVTSLYWWMFGPREVYCRKSVLIYKLYPCNIVHLLCLFHRNLMTSTHWYRTKCHVVLPVLLAVIWGYWPLLLCVPCSKECYIYSVGSSSVNRFVSVSRNRNLLFPDIPKPYPNHSSYSLQLPNPPKHVPT